MLLFNQKYDTDIQVHFNFNTSNVTIQHIIYIYNANAVIYFNTSNVTIQPPQSYVIDNAMQISIHLMLLFNDALSSVCIEN